MGTDTGKGDFFENLEAYFEEPAPAPTQPSQPELLTEPPVTQPSTQPESEPQKPCTPREKAWILLPAVGTALLTLLTVCLNAPDEKEKF